MNEIFRVAQIHSRMMPYEWAFPHEAAARIDAHWAQQCRLKPGLFDGLVMLAHRWAVEADTLVVAYFETRFRNFLSWRDFGFPGTGVANCFSMAALRSADGAFMLGEMSAGTANEGKLYFPSGTPEPKDVLADGHVDLESSVVRELEEETGLTPPDVVLEPGWTIVATGTRPAIACMKGVNARATAAALQERLQAANAGQDDPELARLVAVRNAADFDPARMPDFMIRYLTDALSVLGPVPVARL